MNRDDDIRRSARTALKDLKGFQRRTVDYAFRRLFLDADSSKRFLVADEVGLGKTMVARGVIAKTVEHLRRKNGRVNVVYVCSNSDIARQNVERLRTGPNAEFVRATRATLLPIEIGEMSKRRVNLVSMTPGTSLEPRGGAGSIPERALLFELLREPWDLDEAACVDVFRFGAGAERFRNYLKDRLSRRTVDAELRSAFIEDVRAEEARARSQERPTIRSRLDAFVRKSRERDGADVASRETRRLFGELRAVLGRTCVRALRPDLVILDEFQRFKHLLDAHSEEADLARSLFERAGRSDGEAARVLLLSATPYKMFTLEHERAEGSDDHFEDFKTTYDFLVAEDPVAKRALRDAMETYRASLFRRGEGRLPGLRSAKAEVERRLRPVMSRIERLAATEDRSGMLREVPSSVRVEAEDVRQYVAFSEAANVLGRGEIVEYWKSAPYLLNFMDDYDLKVRFREAADGKEAAALAKALDGESKALLSFDDVEAYRRVDPMNGRLRALLEDTVERGLWKLLWLPPSFPYFAPRGAFAEPGVEDATKRLVFSSWRIVPKAIACVLSHEAERRMTSASDGEGVSVGYRNTAEDRDRYSQLLRFGRSDGRLTGMPLFLHVYPSSTLTNVFDPAFDGAPTRTAAEALHAARMALDAPLEKVLAKWAGDGDVDERWYWACPLLMDLSRDPVATREFWRRANLAEEWAGASDKEASDGDEDVGSAWRDHAAVAAAVATEAAIGGGRPLGRPPADLPDVMATACLGSPAVLVARAMSRVLDLGATLDPDMRVAAGRVAWRLRGLFNLRETATLLREAGGGTPYWLRVMEYAIDGCLQAVFDEYAHVLRGSLALERRSPGEAASAIADEMIAAVAIRSATVEVDDVRADAGSGTVRIERRKMRTRFAARFAHQKGEAEKDGVRAARMRVAFNSPFWPFVLASTSVGQEGLDFHQFCHSVVHWNLPSNPADFEQREGRVHRFKGHAVRKNVARTFGGVVSAPFTDRWRAMFDAAAAKCAAATDDVSPYWVFTAPGGAAIERRVLSPPLSRDAGKLTALRSSLALYRMAFGQPRQDELLEYLKTRLSPEERAETAAEIRVDLEPPYVELEVDDGVVESQVGAEGSDDSIEGDDLFETAREVLFERDDIRVLGRAEGRLWPFVPASWTRPFPPLGRGRGVDPSWLLFLRFNEDGKGAWDIALVLVPMPDLDLRLRIVDRLVRDKDEFGLDRRDFINFPSVWKHWLFLRRDEIAPVRGHGLSREGLRARMNAFVDDYVRRFSGVQAAIFPLFEGE